MKHQLGPVRARDGSMTEQEGGEEGGVGHAEERAKGGGKRRPDLKNRVESRLTLANAQQMLERGKQEQVEAARQKRSKTKSREKKGRS